MRTTHCVECRRNKVTHEIVLAGEVFSLCPQCFGQVGIPAVTDSAREVVEDQEQAKDLAAVRQLKRTIASILPRLEQ